jgi:hypothetical protein
MTEKKAPSRKNAERGASKQTPARKKAAPKVPETRVAVLRTDSFPLVIRGNPSEEEVRGFVAEHSRRHVHGEAGGPNGERAHAIQDAFWFDEEPAEGEFDFEGAEQIDLGDSLKTPGASA